MLMPGLGNHRTAHSRNSGGYLFDDADDMTPSS
jgi:hypothetical protein